MQCTFLFHKPFVPLASLCLCGKMVPAANKELHFFFFFYTQNTAFLWDWRADEACNNHFYATLAEATLECALAEASVALYMASGICNVQPPLLVKRRRFTSEKLYISLFLLEGKKKYLFCWNNLLYFQRRSQKCLQPNQDLRAFIVVYVL